MILPLGDDGLRILCGPGPVRHQIARHLMAKGGWTDIVPGKEDVSVFFDPHAGPLALAIERLSQEIRNLPEDQTGEGRLHIIPAVFGGDAGPDLGLLAEQMGRSEESIISAISGAEFLVDLLGFTPGFAYLAGHPGDLQAERLSEPRVRVPAGSIGVLTGQAGLYALEGPGGWPIVGRALIDLFQRDAAQPFLLAAGDRVRFAPKGAV